MIRRIAATLACLLLAAAAFALLDFPLPAYAQNTGEAPVPKPKQAQDSSETQKTDNKKSGGQENNPDKKAKPKAPADKPATGDASKTGDPAKSGSDADKSKSDAGSSDGAEAGSSDASTGEKKDGKSGGDEGANVAEGANAESGDAKSGEAAEGAADGSQNVAEGTGGEDQGPPAPPAGEAGKQPEGATGKQPEGSTGGEQGPPAPQGPPAQGPSAPQGPPPPPNGKQPAGPSAEQQAQANAAESRPAGTSIANAAEKDVDENGNWIPPEPPFTLPSPAEEAGSAENYQKPGLSLEVPGLTEAPEGASPDSYYQPNRTYLENRPLAPVSETETDEERISRNIEESLKLLDLSAEERPKSGIQIPLPSGVVTFKASDSFSFDRKNRILTFRGNAEILFEDIAIWADMIEVNDGAATAYAKGYVAVQNKDEILYCDEAYLNYDTKILELFYVEGNTGGPRLNGTLYFTADRAYGTFDNLIMEHAEVTTCEPFCGSVDEFHLSARKVVYKRNKSIVLHDVHPYMRSHKIGWIPILAFPLQRQQEYQQEPSDISQTYGYNRSEGMFAKFAYTYSVKYAENVTKALLGVAKLDITQKKGPNIGLRQDFLIPTMGVGTVRAEYQEEWPWSVQTLSNGAKASPEQNTHFEYSQELHLSPELDGNFAITRNNTFVPARTINGTDRRTNTWRNNFNLNYRRNKTNATLTVSQNINITGGTTQQEQQQPRREAVTDNANLSFSRDLSKELQLKLSEQYTSTKGAAGRENLPADQEGAFQMDLNWTGERETSAEGYAAKLTYMERGIDFDGNANTTDRNVQVRKELPSLQVTLPRDLINDGAYFTNFRVNVDNLVTGRRSLPESSLRGTIDVAGQDTIDFSKSSRLSSNSSFEQDWYDDGNAQYIIQQGLNYTYNTYSWFQATAGWNMTFHQGVKEPPVQGDRRTYSQRSSYSFIFTNRKSWRWTLRGGYDFGAMRHNPVSSTYDWDPNRTFGMTNTVTYDIVNRKFVPSHTIVSLRSPYIDPDGYYNWIVNTTLDTDIEHNFRTSRLDFKWAKRFKRGWSTEVTTSFRDGRDQPIDFNEDFLKDFVKKIVVRKVNCCTTIEGGWRTGINEIYVNVFLNALPQYPSTTDILRPFDDQAKPDFLFPVNQLQQDILRDMFGINQQLF